MDKIFEIRKAGFLNKGAALMLIAALREIRARIPDAIVAVAPDYTYPFQARADHGLWQRVEVVRSGIDIGKALDFVPQRWRRRYGFVTEKEVNVILDAAGLAYSDQWGAEHVLELSRRARRWKSCGKKFVMLPQALGPFASTVSRNAIREVADNADLIFARDIISYQHLVNAVGERPSIRRAPDFTNLLPPADPGDCLAQLRKPIAIVPNSRMLDKTDPMEAGCYVGSMREATEHLRHAGLDPFLLIHEGLPDKYLGDEINRGLETPMMTLWPNDPLMAKGIIGSCEGVVASRFHALVSALAQGVPAIGTSWSHKYQELFVDYECPECLLEVAAPTDERQATLASLTDINRRTRIKSRLGKRSMILKDQSRQMWSEVFETLS